MLTEVWNSHISRFSFLLYRCTRSVCCRHTILRSHPCSVSLCGNVLLCTRKGGLNSLFLSFLFPSKITFCETKTEIVPAGHFCLNENHILATTKKLIKSVRTYSFGEQLAWGPNSCVCVCVVFFFLTPSKKSWRIMNMWKKKNLLFPNGSTFSTWSMDVARKILLDDLACVRE